MENKITRTLSNKTDAGMPLVLIVSEISFFRTVVNKKNDGYVTIIGLKDNAQDQVVMFETYEEAEEFHEGMVNEIGNDLFVTYVSQNDELVSIEKESVSFIRGTDNKRGSGKVAIIGLAHFARSQHEFFEDQESCLEFIKDMSNKVA